MTAETEHLILEHLRRLRVGQEEILSEVRDLKHRVVERQFDLVKELHA
jgi:hypothetical protein